MKVCRSNKSELEKLFPASYLGMFGAIWNMLKNEEDILKYAFLQPEEKGSSINWSYADPNVLITGLKKASEWSIEDKSLVRNMLSALSTTIFLEIKTTDVSGFEDVICNTPDKHSIFVLNTTKGDRIAIANWGHEVRSKNKGYSLHIEEFAPPARKYPTTIKAVYSDEQPAKHEKIILQYNENKKTVELDDNGEYNLGKLPDQSRVDVSYKDGGLPEVNLGNIKVTENQQNHTLYLDECTYLDISIDRNYTDADHFARGKLISDKTKHELKFDDGKCHIENLNVGTTYTAILYGSESSKEITLERGGNHLVIDYVPKGKDDSSSTNKEENVVRFHFFDYKKLPLEIKNAQVIRVNNEIIELQIDSDENSWKLPAEKIKETQKIVVKFVYLRNEKEKKGSSTFMHREADKFHKIKLKKKWWMIGLTSLIIPFLLFFSYSKSFNISLIDEGGMPVENSIVEYNYQHTDFYNFEEKQFIQTKMLGLVDTSNQYGEVKFKNLKGSLFDMVINPVKKASIAVTNTKKCLKDSQYVSGYYFNKVKDLDVRSDSEDFTFYVRHAITGDAIKGSTVNFNIVSRGDTIVHEKLSDSNGEVVLSNVSNCSYLSQSEAVKDNYFPYSINDKYLFDLNSGQTKTFFLSNTFPCDSIERGDVAGGIFVMHLPNQFDTYIFHYDFMEIPDSLVLYKGTSNKGKILMSPGWQGNEIERYIKVKPVDFCDGCEYLTAQIYTYDEGTGWEVFLECAE